MSTLADLFAECVARGIRLAPADGGLAIDGPRDAMTPDLLARLTEAKADLLRLLGHAGHAVPTAPAAPANLDDTPVVAVDDDADGTDASGNPTIDPDTLPPCPGCGPMLDAWRDWLGRWHCARCGRGRGLPPRSPRPRPGGAASNLNAPTASGRSASAPCCRCGSSRFVDVPVHGGASLRRDCAECGRFISFPVWHGRP
jgi:hypothetical protein